jgi:hypothetical protein
MSRFFIASSIGFALLTIAPGCSGEQGASVAPLTTPVAPADDSKAKLNTAGEKPTVKVSPIQ